MTRCPKCPGVNKCVGGDGPRSCGLLFIGEGPEDNENKADRVFVGKTGQELDRHYLPAAGLRRSDVRIVNAISCLPDRIGGKLDGNRQADLDLLESCANHHLYPEIIESKPKLLIPMGAFACRAIDPEINLELHHGMPLETDWGLAFPMYRPAGGIHEPKKMLTIRTDWIRLKKYLAGSLHIAQDPYPEPDYRLADAAQVYEDLEGNIELNMGADTETMKGGSPFCLTYSVQPGTGRLIKATDNEALSLFQSYISKWRGKILFHNWLFDIRSTRAMGLTFPHKRIVDTMLRAFHLGNLPQGLKMLAYRELGMLMTSFEDVVLPYSRELVLDYYRQCMSEEWPIPDPQMERGKGGAWKVYKPQGFNAKLKRFFTDYARSPNSKDVFEMWDKTWPKTWPEMHEVVQERLWPWPGVCISHAPFEEVLTYACRDSDAVLRLYPLLNRMRRRVRKVAQERWSEAA